MAAMADSGTGTEIWVSVRTSRAVQWSVSAAVTASLGFSAWLLAGLALVPAALAGAAVLMLTGWLIVALPRQWTGQGVSVGADGLIITARRLAWFRGSEAVVGWDEVHAVRRGTRTAGRGPGVPRGPAAFFDRLSSLGAEVTLEFHLLAPRPLDLPPWAVEEGTRLVLTVADTPRQAVERAVRVVRADLLDPRPTTVPASRRPGAPGTTGWVSLRGAGFLPLWQGMAGPTLYVIGLLCAAFLGYAGVRAAVHGLGDDDLAVVALLFPFGAAAAGWTLHRLPRLLTRQGVAADDAGVALVQEPLWWFAGATTQLPWPELRSVSEDVLVIGDDKNRRSHRVVELRLHHDHAGPLPSWVEVKSRRRQKTGLVIVPGRRRHARVLAVLRAAGPEYFPD